MKGLCLLTSQLLFFFMISLKMKKFKSVNMGIFMEIYRSIVCMKRLATTDPKHFHFLIQMLIIFKAIVTQLASPLDVCMLSSFLSSDCV